MSTKQNISEIKFPVEYDHGDLCLRDANEKKFMEFSQTFFSRTTPQVIGELGVSIAQILNEHAQIKDELETLKSACEMALKHFEARERICNAEGGSVYGNEINQLKGVLQNGK